jgi:LacI family transcriptional regulator
MGRHAARLLLNMINAPDSPPLRITLPPQLILRGSTDVPRKVRPGAQHRTTQR